MSAYEVSILICVHNRLDMTTQCLSTLQSTVPPELPVEILIYDDQSTDDTPAFLESLGKRVRVFREPERGFFAHNQNRLAREARGRWLCQLNNDTILYPGWLTEMLALTRQHPEAAVVGNFHRFPQNDTINHSGIVFDQTLTARHLYVGMPDQVPATHRWRQFQCVSAACWLVSAERYAQLGGMDEQYHNGFEDLDLCLRARQEGDEVWYCGTSRIDHYGQSTPGRMNHEEANCRLFLERWGDIIQRDLEHYTHDDGQDWPPRSWKYRLAYGLWRNPVVSPLARALMRTSIGVRLRQKMLSVLNRE